MYLDDDTARYRILMVTLGSLAAAWFIVTIGQGIYNVSLHPLAKFPGPKLRGAFNFAEAYSIFTGYHELHIRQLHDEYGSVVRIMPNALSFSSAQAWKDIYGFRQGKKQLKKDRSFYRPFKGPVPDDIIYAGDAKHATVRRLLANAFSDNALRSQEEILNHYFELFISRLNEKVDSPSRGIVNMVGWYNFTTFDIIGDLAFGESFHSLEDRDYHPWIATIFQRLKFNRWIRLGGMYPSFMLVLTTLFSLFPGLTNSRDKHVSFTRDKTKARLDTDTDRNDFIAYILRAKEDKAMTQDEIIANSGLLILAGSETTATLLSGVTYYLLQNPAKLALLQAEVRTAFASPKDMSFVSVSKLPYLHAVLEEGLRMFPPVPSLLPRVTPPEGDLVDGHFVPGNISLGVHQLSAYRSADNWTDPDEFVPERWLHGNDKVPERYSNDKREALQPFSTGPRNCLGKNLAYNEMRAILARAVWHFDMELMPESRDWANQQAYTLWIKPELMVRLSHRQEAQ